MSTFFCPPDIFCGFDPPCESSFGVVRPGVMLYVRRRGGQSPPEVEHGEADEGFGRVEAERTSHDEPELGIHRLDDAVG